MSVDICQQNNQQALVSALARLRAALLRHIGEVADTPDDVPTSGSTLEAVARMFELSPFECDLLLLCAAVELDGEIGELVSRAQAELQSAPTFSLALAALPGAHWSALSPQAALRRNRLIEIGPGAALTTSPLRISEPVLHFLVGAPTLDERLLRMLEPVSPSCQLPPSHAAIAQQVAEAWRWQQGERPIGQLNGVGHSDARALAAAISDMLDMRPHALAAHRLPSAPADVDVLAALWQRDAVLTNSVLLLEVDDLDDPDHERQRLARRFAEQISTPLLLSSRERLTLRRTSLHVELERPQPAEQRDLWRSVLGPLAAPLNGQIDQLTAQFSLDGSRIAQLGSETRRTLADHAQPSPDRVRETLWRLCRTQARHQLDDLAQRIEPFATWDDLVLPPTQRTVLHDLASHVRQRAKVYETWGFDGGSGRGLGISALFAGPSGTGKTTAAEVLAGVLQLDLYRIDLSGVVSKFIGETEKNLRRIFDAAEQSGAILLFDEADALFGKRGEVKDSHDRYANIEVGYLLQRMEAYRGLAILTTNLKHSIDPAFLRRLRFVVQFPFPDPVQRAEIWQKVFPPATPRAALDYEKLARLTVAGGNIRTIAVNAAFIAADASEPVSMSHILRATRVEYAKLEKALTESEIAGWV